MYLPARRSLIISFTRGMRAEPKSNGTKMRGGKNVYYLNVIYSFQEVWSFDSRHRMRSESSTRKLGLFACEDTRARLLDGRKETTV